MWATLTAGTQCWGSGRLRLEWWFSPGTQSPGTKTPHSLNITERTTGPSTSLGFVTRTLLSLSQQLQTAPPEACWGLSLPPPWAQSFLLPTLRQPCPS